MSGSGTPAVRAAGTRDPGTVVSPAGAPVEIRLLRLRWSNAYLLIADRAVLVDAGSPGDEAAILEALAALGRGSGDLAAIVLTHGHADHAGAAAAVRAATGAPILLGAGDVAMAATGRNVQLVPTGLEARLVAPFVPQAFPPVEPDEVLEDPRDLSSFGVPATARPLGGHTRGSAVVELGGDVLVGDLVRGGRLGGRWRGAVPMTHYYEEEPASVTSVVDAVLQGGARRLLVGHGGPLDAAAVGAWRRGRPG